MSNEIWVTPEDALNVPSEGSWSSKATFIPATNDNLGEYIPTRWLNADSSSVVTPDFPVINEDNLNKIELGIALLDSFFKNDSVGYSYNIKRLQEVVDALYESLTSLHSYVDYWNRVQDTTLKETVGTIGNDVAFSKQNPISDAIGKVGGSVFISKDRPLLNILGTDGDGVNKKCAFGTLTSPSANSTDRLTVKATIEAVKATVKKEIQDRIKAVGDETKSREEAIGTESDSTTTKTVYGSINSVRNDLGVFAEDIKKALGTVNDELAFNEDNSVHKTISDLDTKLQSKVTEIYSDIGASTSTDSNTVYGYVNNNIGSVSNDLDTVEKKFDDKFNTFTLNDVNDTEQEEIVLDAGTSIGYT